MQRGSKTTGAAANLSDKVHKAILDLISDEGLLPQDKLPSEGELAQRFGVSRPIVREGLLRLRTEGIVESRRGSGSYIVRLPQQHAAAVATPIESIADIDRYYAFRLCVEVGVARIAAEQRDDSDLRAIREAYAGLAGALAAGASSVEEDVRFHLAVAAASHNQFFIRTMDQIVVPFRQCLELSHNLWKTKNDLRRGLVETEHQAIVEAIAQRSAERAAEAMAAHIANARRRIFHGE